MARLASQDESDSEPLSNPKRGCGHLQPGKTYLVGGGFSELGVLPSWVELDPHLPYREVGTEGQFTRGFQKIEGLTMQLALEEITEFVPHYPGNSEHETAIENHVIAGLYDDPDDVPEKEADRHIGRVRERGVEGGEHWGEIPTTEQTDLLMRAGTSYYPEPEDYAQETIKFGLSKAIPVTPTRDPPAVVAGLTRCWIMHPEACEGHGGGIIGFAYLSEVAFTEPEEGDLPSYIEEAEEAGKLTVREMEEPWDPDPDEEEESPDAALGDFDGDEGGE